jgi:hypothetical protein
LQRVDSNRPKRGLDVQQSPFLKCLVRYLLCVLAADVYIWA